MHTNKRCTENRPRSIKLEKNTSVSNAIAHFAEMNKQNQKALIESAHGTAKISTNVSPLKFTAISKKHDGKGHRHQKW